MLLYNILIFNDTLHTWLHHYAVSTLAPRRKVGWLLVLSHTYTPAGSLAASSLVQHLLGSAAHLHQVQPEAASHADCVDSEHASLLPEVNSSSSVAGRQSSVPAAHWPPTATGLPVSSTRCPHEPSLSCWHGLSGLHAHVALRVTSGTDSAGHHVPLQSASQLACAL